MYLHKKSFNSIIINDIKTRAIIKIIQDLNLNNALQRLDYKIFQNTEKEIIRDYYSDISYIEVLNIYKGINRHLNFI